MWFKNGWIHGWGGYGIQCVGTQAVFEIGSGWHHSEGRRKTEMWRRRESVEALASCSVFEM